jgi:cellulose synthase/poly-beta-1,6-N-acetylglucosamine synthase-like glycosyltransferase
MTGLSAGLLLLAAWLAVWSYLLYPPWIRLLSRRRPAREAPGGPAPSVEVLVAAADEERVIGARVADLLAQEYPGDYAIAVGCDGCTDGTAREARQGLRGAGRVVEFPARRGKAAVLNDLIASSRAEVIVFTDANTRFDPGAVGWLSEAMSAPGVGAACGRLWLEAEGGRLTPETLFWDRETRLKEAEGRLGMCLGANGAIYAARRLAIAPLPPDSVLDDFLIPARIAAGGADVVFVGNAVAREPLPRDVRDELSRRFRIGVGGGQVLRAEPWLWSARRPLLAFVFFSRKAARWIAPVAALLSALAAAASPALRLAGLAALALAAFLLLGARAGIRLPGALGRIYYFAVINLAVAAGVAAGLFGYRRPAWKRTGRT